MPRRKGQDAELAIKKERWNRWRIMLRRAEFQTSLNQLRRQYRKWVKGPPITLYTYALEDGTEAPPDYVIDERGIPNQDEGKISRKYVDLDEHECDPNDPMVGIEGAWVHFNSKWGIRLPKVALTKLRDLSPSTIAEWEPLGQVGGTVTPPAVTSESYKRRLDRLTLTVDLGYPRDVLLARIDEELTRAIKLHKAKPKGFLSAKRKRRRYDKLSFQLQVYDLYMNNERTEDIAKELAKPLGTVKSALATALNLIGDHLPRTGGWWEKRHLKECPGCRRMNNLEFDCPQVLDYYKRKAAAAEAARADSTYLPPLPVKSEKSAFARWDARHPPRRRP